MFNARRRTASEINASSMADIAFLLLIFFLVTTEITEDQGVLARLPPIDIPVEVNVPPSQLLPVLVNKDDELLVRGEPLAIGELRDYTKAFITNPEGRSDFPKTSVGAIISLKNDRGTSYATYVSVYNELLGAYNELWESAAQSTYGRAYESLNPTQRNAIRARIPLVLSEAEPSGFGE